MPTKVMMARRAVIGVLLLAGCVTATTGQPISSEAVKRITVGVTTKAEVRAAFGSPPHVRPIGANREMWAYRYSAVRVAPGSSEGQGQQLFIIFDGDVVGRCQYSTRRHASRVTLLGATAQPTQDVSKPCDVE